jgi:hypothetical protein
MSNDFKVGDLVVVSDDFFKVRDIRANAIFIYDENGGIFPFFLEDIEKTFRHATLEEKQAYYQQKIDKAQKELEKLKAKGEILV